MRRVIAVAIAVYLLLVFFERFVLVELLLRRVGIPFLFAVAAALACVGAGFLARRLRPDAVLNLIVGYPILGTICFLVGLLEISTWTMVAVVGILGGIGAVSLRRAGEGAGAPLRLKPFALVALAAVVAAGFIAAQAPPSTLDELAYHLAVPWTWVKEGRAIELPLNSHSYFPLGVESADLPFLTILGTGGGIASHFLHLIAAVAVMALLLRTTKQCPILTAAIVATPALALTAGWSLVDWVLLGVSLALVIALESEDRATIAAAIAAGFLTKYTFIPIALIAYFAVVGRRLGGRWPLHRAALAGALFGSVFFLRNLILTGDPFAPFFSALAPHVTQYRAGAFLSNYIFDGQFIDESLGISMLMACTLAAGLLSWLFIGAGVLLFALAPSARLLVPFFAIPAARALTPTRPMRILLAIAVSLQLLLIVFFTDRTEALGLMTARFSDEQYLARARPSIATVSAIDADLPPNSRTLLIGLSETFWFQHRVRGGGNFDGPRVSHYLEAGTPDALYTRLKRDGITHVAVVSMPPPTAVVRKVEERETALSTIAQRTLAQTLDRYAASVTARGNSTLFTLR